VAAVTETKAISTNFFLPSSLCDNQYA